MPQGEVMPKELSGRRVEILECTLRDGSYAVDFKFTENDTAVLAGVLGRLGFRWIEVGHGVGLGACKAGKGTMPTSDERLIEVAKRAAPNAQIGCFFIPGIGTADQLKSARAAGLDFVRIGYNAPEIEDAFPYLTLAKELGLKVLPQLHEDLRHLSRSVWRESERWRGGWGGCHLLRRLRGQHVPGGRTQIFQRCARTLRLRIGLPRTQQSSVCRCQQRGSRSLRRRASSTPRFTDWGEAQATFPPKSQ